MRIVVLNECFFNTGHINRLKALGTIEFFTDTDNEDKVIERIKNAEIVVADPFIAPINKKVLESTDTLKLVVINVISTNVVDVETATLRGVKIANIPGYSTEAVAELTFGLILSVARAIPLGDKRMRETPFEVDSGNSEHAMFKGLELKGKTLGIIGLGRIGQRVGELGNAFGMKVIGFNKTEKQIDGIKQVLLDELLKSSDIVTIHLKFSIELDKFISTEQFKLMKSGAVLINTAPMSLIDEDALYSSLVSGKLSGAGLDVMAHWHKDNPLLKLDNVVVTPHEGYLTDGSMKNISEMVVSNIENFMDGKPQNLVN